MPIKLLVVFDLVFTLAWNHHVCFSRFPSVPHVSSSISCCPMWVRAPGAQSPTKPLFQKHQPGTFSFHISKWESLIVCNGTKYFKYLKNQKQKVVHDKNPLEVNPWQNSTNQYLWSDKLMWFIQILLSQIYHNNRVQKIRGTQEPSS